MTKVEFVEWVDHPVTKEMMRLFGEVREAYVDRLVSGDTLGKEVQTAKTVGVVKGLDFFLKAEYENED